MKSIFFLALVFLAGASEEAGAVLREGVSTVGNGGSVVDCPDQANPVMLDIFEMKSIQHRNVSIEAVPGDEGTKLEFILQQLAKVSAYRADLYRRQLTELRQNTTFGNNELPQIPDSLHIIIPEHCVVRQVAIQYRFGGKSRLEINQEIWNRMDAVNRAALLMHETVYAEAIDRGHRDSLATRALNGILLSPNYSAFTLRSSRFALDFEVDIPLPSGEILLIDPRRSFIAQDSMSDVFGGRFSGKLRGVSGLFVPGRGLFTVEDGFDATLESGVVNLIKSSGKNGFDARVFGLDSPVEQMSLIEPVVTFQTSVSSAFAGHTFSCAKQTPVTYTASSFQPHIGYGENRAVAKCRASFDGPFLPARYAPRLRNHLPFYEAEFFYSGETPTGFRWAIPRGAQGWNLGFSLHEDLTFPSYKEDWTRGIFELNEVSGTIMLTSTTQPCRLNDSARFLAGPRPVLLMGSSSEGSCEFIPGMRLARFEQDDQRQTRWVEPAMGEKLPFLGQLVQWQGRVQFRNGQPVIGEIVGPFFGKITINQKIVQRWFPNGSYKVLADGTAGLIALNGYYGKMPLPETFEIRFYNEVTTVSALSQWGRPDASLRIMETAVLTSDLVFVKGTLGEGASLPICEWNRVSESVSVQTRTVPLGTSIELRNMRSGDTPFCYWINEGKKGR